MAEKIELELQLKSELGKATQDFKDISKAGGFIGPSGAKAANRIQSFIDTLNKIDIKNLDEKGVQNFLNTLSKLRHYLDISARGLSNYSEEYIKQQKKVEQAQYKLSQAQDKETEALKKQAEIQEKIEKSSATFFSQKTGKQVTKAETITDLFSKNQLDIYSSKGKDAAPLRGSSLDSVRNMLSSAVKTQQEVQAAKTEVKTEQANVKAEKLVLENTNAGGVTHPTTTQVTGNSAFYSEWATNTKENINATLSQQNAQFDLNNNVEALNKQSTSLGKAFKQFSIYAIAVRTARQALNAAAKTIKDLDKYLTEQAMVTGRTRKETYALLKSYQQMASELGATTKEIAEVATQFMRQGKTAQEAMTLTRAAVSAAKVAGISATESVNYLTTALNGFRLSAEDAMRVSDKFASIAAQSATSYEEIAIALSKVAAQANMAGMSIDYTTALLAKGIETTREAPETIGTALKTIIARMRELTDYGATLEDGMNINNVETQLQYVGIALRDQNGELRSTEEVLDQLGEKWEELSSNQQAAIAKALAGTRQQSRLIAMMSDYERVTELQQIAERSAGATAAQASTYMQGMEAALNKVSVAWEKITTAVTNSDVIINVINFVSNFLDKLGSFLSTDFGMVTSVATVASLTLLVVGRKMKEYQISRQIRQIQLQEAAQQAKKNRLIQEAIITEKKAAITSKEKLITELNITRQKAIQNKESTTEIDAQIAKETASLETLKGELTLEESKLNIYKEQETYSSNQLSIIGKMSTSLSGLMVPLTMAITAWKTISGLISLVSAKKTKAHAKAMKEGLEENSLNATKGAGEIISQLGVWGIPIAVAVAAALAGISLAIGAAISTSSKSSTERAAEDINKLSNEIYKLSERANAINQIEKQYDALDKQIIKTAADQEKMNELLDSAADKLSSEAENGEKSDKEVYEALQSTQAKREFLAEKEAEYRDKANDARKEQIQILRSLNEQQRTELLTAKDANSLMAQDAVFALNNNTLYEYIDSLEDVNDGVEKMTQSILEMLTAEQAWAYANDENGESIKRLADTLNNAVDSDNNSLVEILTSDENSIKEKIGAYEQLKDAVADIGDPQMYSAFIQAYKQWDDLSMKMTKSAIDYIDKIGMSVDGINNLGAAIQKLGYSTDEATEKLNSLFAKLEGGQDLRTAIQDVLDVEGGDYQKILNAYEKATGVTLLNIGQNIKSLQSQINSFYEKASKWGEMDETERTQFIQDNYALFQGENGAALYQAFEEGNYKAIQQALATNEALREQIALRLQDLKTRLQIAEAQEKINDAEVNYLKEQISLYEDYMDKESSVYQADLKLRLEKEQAQLDLYKEYLEKQKEALTDSLDKRKEAYEKYFDAIDREEANEEYDAKADLLTANLSKLASSTNASAMQQTKELQQKFEELEKERLQELRERAREDVLSNLDTEVSQINEKFDKLLEDQAALLAAMQGEIAEDPNGFSNRLISSGIENMTATQAEDFIKNSFLTSFASELQPETLSSIKEQIENLYLNVNGQEIQIGDSAQQDLYLTVMNALRQLGLK